MTLILCKILFNTKACELFNNFWRSLNNLQCNELRLAIWRVKLPYYIFIIQLQLFLAALTQRVTFETWDTSDIWSEWQKNNKKKDKKAERLKFKKTKTRNLRCFLNSSSILQERVGYFVPTWKPLTFPKRFHRIYSTQKLWNLKFRGEYIVKW